MQVNDILALEARLVSLDSTFGLEFQTESGPFTINAPIDLKVKSAWTPFTVGEFVYDPANTRMEILAIRDEQFICYGSELKIAVAYTEDQLHRS